MLTIRTVEVAVKTFGMNERRPCGPVRGVEIERPLSVKADRNENVRKKRWT